MTFHQDPELTDAHGRPAVFRVPHQTLHRKGTPEYDEHVKNEQQAMREHTEQLAGRTLTRKEAKQLDEAVEQAIARCARPARPPWA